MSSAQQGTEITLVGRIAKARDRFGFYRVGAVQVDEGGVGTDGRDRAHQ
ncbi:hypothetical protein Corgl_0832 [Coriobacterium glomerans PW2]|uniref:Uncharacterized protein n=1 Tax=Coriobacterium glomerans (strain ATCC 49209 / DSM 20642 / JCM 10262 / PW2) TaxID=700015 RepID=F2N7Q3_CORGP|nr:hypothetical protein [Coriobacterium glomerans]AEB06945.1 hypothetical protein Corgl_0832 [Coriobacterium glomerans PW2]